MALKVLLTMAFSVLALHSAECGRILAIFPTPSISHQVVFQALMRDLAARGHELTILSTDPLNLNNPNVTEVDWHSSYSTFRNGFNFAEFKHKKLDELDMMDAFLPVMIKMIDEQMQHPYVQRLIHEREKHHFDIVIVEHLMYFSYSPFAVIYDTPIVGITSLDTINENHEWIGNTANPILHPEMMFPFMQGPLDFSERWRVLNYFLRRKLQYEPKFFGAYKDIIHQHFPNYTVDFTDLQNRVEFVMTNTHPALGFIRPLLPNTIQLGFMHIEPSKPLKEGELKTFLNNSEHGVIYMSLGSNVQSKDLGPEFLKMFLNVFSSLKFEILWKFEADHLPNKPKNVMIQKWLPQADLLAHPKIKLFITQGGQQSMEETIDRGVPTIVIPFLADQYQNAKRMEQRNFGKYLELHTLTEERLRETILEMVKPVYKENVLKFRELVYDEPMTSREKAVWWTEYVIRHRGAKHLFYSGRQIPVYQQYFLDFAAMALAVLTMTILSLLVIFKFISKRLSSTKVKEQ